MGPGKDPCVNSGGALRRRAAGSAATLSLGARASRPQHAEGVGFSDTASAACPGSAGVPPATRRRRGFFGHCIGGVSWERGRPRAKRPARRRGPEVRRRRPATWQSGRGKAGGAKRAGQSGRGKAGGTPALPGRRVLRTRWIPAFAGMTKVGGTPALRGIAGLRPVAGETPALPGSGPSPAGGTPALPGMHRSQVHNGRLAPATPS